MSHQDLSGWKTSRTAALPDFIIGGAMKSGTSTLHTILNSHPDIFLPEGELHFFDIDDLFQHRDFHFYVEDRDQWTYQLLQDNMPTMWNWYLANFEGSEKPLTGEDSTTYLASSKAARRIALQEKDIKLIFLLRHPTERAYSQYYHMLRSGHIIYDFERTIRINPGSILQRSFYKKQLQYYFELIPRNQIKVILFEDFIGDINKTMREICDFLGVDFTQFDEDSFHVHSNKSKLPAFLKLQRYHNRLSRWLGNFRNRKSLSETPIHGSKEAHFSGKMLKKAHRLINPLTRDQKPPMRKSTRSFLDDYLFNKLQGIDELVGKEILSIWFPDKVK